MKFSKKINDFKLKPAFRQRLDANTLRLTLEKVGLELEVYYSVVQEDEITYTDICYWTDYEGEYLGVIDGFFSLAQGKPVEAVDRIGIKELDFFLRDDNSIPSFEFYAQEIYEILSIGESLKDKIIPKKNKIQKIVTIEDFDFFEISYSEQIEYFEELLSKYIYPFQKFHNYELDCDIDLDTMTFQIISNQQVSEELMALLKAKLEFEFDILKTSFTVS